MAPSAISASEVETPVRVKPAVPHGDEVEKKEKTPLEMISQGVCLESIPTFVSFHEHRKWMLSHMVRRPSVFSQNGAILTKTLCRPLLSASLPGKATRKG